MDEDDGDMMETVVPDSDPDDDEDLYAKRLMCEMTDSLELSHSFKVIPSTKGSGNAEGFSSQVSLLSKQKIHETQTDKYVTEKTDFEKTTEEMFGLIPGTATAHRDVLSQQFRSVVVDLHSTENAEQFSEYRSDRIIAQSRAEELEFNRDEHGSSAMSPPPVAKASVTSCVEEEKVKPFVKKETSFPFSCLPESQIIGLETQWQVAGAASEKCPSASVSGLEPQYSLSCQAAKDLMSVSHVNLSNPSGSSSTVTDTEVCTQQMRNVTDRKPSSAKQLSWITINRRNHYGETILFKAVQNEDRDLVKEIIKAGGKVNVTDYAGWTPLHEASLSGSCEMAEELLKQGANVNCGGRMGMTPLHEAVNCGNYWMVRLLLLYGADPSIENDAGETAVGQATDELRKLIEIYSPGHNSRSEKGKTDFFEVLGGEVCSKRETVNTDGTDLCSASVTDGHGQRTQAGAYRECSSAAVPNKSKSQKNTGSNRQPFKTKTGKSLVVTSINRRNYFGETLLLRAVQDGDTQLLSEMLKVGASANRADNAGWTPLHEAVSGNHYEMVFDLLNAGAIVNCKAEYGTTPLQIAVQRENHKIIQLLLSRAADPLLKDEQGISALEQTNEISLKKLMKSYLCPAKRESESGKSLLNSTDNIKSTDGKQLIQRQKKRKEDSAVVLKKPTPVSGAQKVGGTCFIEVKERVNRNVGNKTCRWELRSGSVKLKEKSADSKPTQKNTITMELSMHHAKVDMQPAKNICSAIGCKGSSVPSDRRKSSWDSENVNKNMSDTSSLSPTPSRCEQDKKSAREQRKDLNSSFDLTSSIKGKLEIIRCEVETTEEGNAGLCSFTSQPSICEREESIKHCAVEHTLCSESNKADVIIDKQLDLAQHSETPSPLPDAFAMKLTNSPVIPSGSKKGKEYETESALDTKDQKPSEENSEMANADYGCTDCDCESDDTLDFTKKVFFSDDQSDDWSIKATQDFIGKREMRDENDSDDNSEGGYTKERDYKSAFGILPVTFEPLDDFSNSVLEPILPFRSVGLNGLQDEASDNETDTVNDKSLTSRQPVELSVVPSTSQTYVLLWH